MCGVCGEIRFDGAQPSLAAVQAMADKLAPRGPDAAGFFSQGAVAFGHRRLSILDLSATGQQPMVDADLGLAIVFNGCIYNFRELRRDARSQGLSLLLAMRHRGHPQGLSRVGRRAASSASTACLRSRSGSATADASCWRATGSASSRSISRRRAAGCALPRRLPALLAAGGVDTDDRSGGAASLHDVPRRGAGAAHHSQGRAQAAARHDPDASSRTAGVARRPIGTLSVGTRREDRALTMADWRDARARRASRPRSSAGASPTCRSACCSPAGSTARWSSRCWRKPATPSDLKTFSIGFDSVGDVAGDEFRYSDLIARRFGTDHHRIRIDGGARARRRCRAPIAAMSEPMVSHDAVGFYLLSEEVSQAREGRAERPGRRRDLRRLPLVSADDAHQRRGRRICPRLFRPRPRRDGRGARAALHEWDYSRDFVEKFFAQARRRAGDRQRACARHRRSCWSTIRSSASTT